MPPREQPIDGVVDDMDAARLPASTALRRGVTLHIALVIAGLSAGGAERVLSLIAGSWVERGHRITLIAFDAPTDPIFHAFDPRIELIRLNIPPTTIRWPRAFAALRRYRALSRTLRRLKPDVTISFLTKINVLTLLAGLGNRRRLIVSERNNPRLQQADRTWTVLLARLLWRADAIVMQTEASLECLQGAARRRAHVIPNPILAEPIPGPSRLSPVIAATGRLTWQKGFDLLIDAFALIAPHHPHWILTIWGEGPDRAALEQRIASHGLSFRIRLPGTSRSPGEWLGQADAFVLSSRYEGFGNALGEAMAAGLPVVAFDCDYGPAEMIRHERDGLLVPAGDVAELAASLDRLLGDAALRTRLSGAARVSATRFEPNAIIARWDRLVEGVMAETRRF